MAPRLRIDPSWLGQLLLQFLANAAPHCEFGSSKAPVTTSVALVTSFLLLVVRHLLLLALCKLIK